MNYQKEYEVVYKWTNGLLEFVSIEQVPIVDYIPFPTDSLGSPSEKPSVQQTRKLDKISRSRQKS